MLGIIASAIVSVMLIFIIAVTYYCSDDKIRSIITDYTDQNLSISIDADEYKLQLFSRFPSMTLAVDNLVVTTDKVKDSLYIPTAEDTLLSVKKADIAMSALPLLAGKFVFAGVFIDSVRANYTIYPDSTSNWDMFIEESGVDTLEIVTEESGDTFIAGFGIKEFTITNADIRYDDRTTNDLFDMIGGSLKLRGGMSIDRGLFVDMDFDSQKIKYISAQEPLLNELSVGVKGQLFVKNDSSAIVLNKTDVRINNISFSCDGSIRKDTTIDIDGIELDLKYKARLPELNELWKIVPKRYTEFAQGITVGGKVACNGSIYGALNQNSLPYIDGVFRTKDVSFAHKDLDGKIDTLDVNILVDLDLNDPKHQNIVINRMNLVGTGIVANVTGQISELTTDPKVLLTTKLNVDAERMLSLFPDTLGVVARGDIDGTLRTNFKLSDITSSNYGKIKAGGNLDIPEFYFELPSDSILLYIDGASINMGTGMIRPRVDKDAKRVMVKSNAIPEISPLGGTIRYDSMRVELGSHNVISSDSLRISLRTAQVQDTTAIVPLSASLVWRNMRADRYDTTWFDSKFLDVKARLYSDKSNRRLPKVKAEIVSDSLSFTPFQDRLYVQRLEFTLDGHKLSPESKRWVQTSNFIVKRLRLYTMHYPLMIQSPLLTFKTDSTSVELIGQDVGVGRSKFTIKGRIDNAWDWLILNDTVSMQLDVNAKRVNINQLLTAMDRGNEFRMRIDSIIASRKDTLIEDKKATQEARLEMVDMAEEQPNGDLYTEEIADTVAPIVLNHVYVIPEIYNVDCNFTAENMTLGKWRMKDAVASFNVNSGVLTMSEMSVNSTLGDLLARGLYTAEDTTSAFAGVAMTMRNIQIGSLLEAVPQFDTIMPMLQSLSGNVNLDFAVAGNWDRNMSVDMNSLNAAACIDGKDLVLMDGETFSMIAKKLKFKNRKRNLIDSLSVSLSMSNGMIDIYPFVFRMDRYKAAVGGRQGLDMSYNYHISILDSPIPFKFGLTIKGDSDDMKFRITKAKYKDLLKPTSKYDVHKIRIDLKDKISDFLDEIKDKSYALPKFSMSEDENDDEEMSDEEIEQALEKYNAE